MVIIMIINFALVAADRVAARRAVVFNNSSSRACGRSRPTRTRTDPSHRSGAAEEFVVAVTANYMVLRSLSLSPPSDP